MRVRVTIEVDCDPIPGEAHEPEDWRRYFEHHCKSCFPWYRPEVTELTVIEDLPRPQDSNNTTQH